MGSAGYRYFAALVVIGIPCAAIAAERGDACVHLANDLARLACFDSAFASAAQDDPVVIACETSLLPHLVSPATYRRATATISDNKVYLAFDSQNYAGGFIRSKVECIFIREKDNLKIRYPEPSIDMILSGKDIIDINTTKMKVEYIPPPPPAQATGPNAVNFSSMRPEDFKSDCAGRVGLSSENSMLLGEPDGSKIVYVRQSVGDPAAATCRYIASGQVLVSKLR